MYARCRNTVILLTDAARFAVCNLCTHTLTHQTMCEKCTKISCARIFGTSPCLNNVFGQSEGATDCIYWPQHIWRITLSVYSFRTHIYAMLSSNSLWHHLPSVSTWFCYAIQHSRSVGRDDVAFFRDRIVNVMWGI